MVGRVPVGGDAPVSIQSMTTTKTADVDGTLAQIYALAAAGCDIVRCTCNEEEAAEALAQIVPLMIDAYRLLSQTTDHPLHLGVTEAGVLPQGLIKGVAGIATLLAEGIGDTIRFSLTADPVEEAKAGRTLLEAMGLRERKGLDLIACPSCGRAEVDVIRVATDAQAALVARNIPLQVAVMGCVVNGPGEAREADLGIAAGRGKGHLFVRGKVVRVVPEAEMVDALVDEGERIMAEGIEARLAAADDGAEAEAERTREELLQIQGTDANAADEKIDKIREIAD